MKPDMSHGNYQKAVIMSAKPQASDFKPITKPDPELIIKSVLDRGTHYAMENMGIMDYMTKYCKACSDVTDIYQPVIAAVGSRPPLDDSLWKILKILDLQLKLTIELGIRRRQTCKLH
ncbi:hypothetical protein RhiirA4_548349 [Rhizophagus irregularis]|uniref:Uncharacterized protein n=1 Tax=Rhizophagus irregularis TaxID=588596 RepID=A0A2I1H745_9GLOM|nr:hypothetical protein RhiirA4_548349 [Rhizophagus irregularis]